MTLTTLAPPRPEEPSVAAPRLARRGRSVARSALAPLLAAAGLLMTTLTAVALTGMHGGAARPGPSGAVPGPLSAPAIRPGDVTVVNQVYEPGETSPWHTHPGVHAVAILAGALTVYDDECRAQVFEPGRPYIGGQELHQVRNEAKTPVVMVVTYVSAPTHGDSNLHPPSPPCAAANPAGTPAPTPEGND